MTVAELRQCLSQWEYLQWLAFYALEAEEQHKALRRAQGKGTGSARTITSRFNSAPPGRRLSPMANGASEE